MNEIPMDNTPSTIEGPENGAARGYLRQGSAIRHIPVTVQVVLGGARMSVAEIVALECGAIVPLDRKIGDPVDILVNGRLIGRGDVVVTDGEDARFAVSLTEIVADEATPRSGNA